MAGLGTSLVFLYGDLVGSLFEWRQGPFWPLVDRYRVELIEAAAEARLPGVIFTFVYARGTDDAFVRRIVEGVTRHGGRVLFVRLTCDRTELLLHRHDLFSDVPYPGTFVIDTTTLRPGRAARLITDHFQLAR